MGTSFSLWSSTGSGAADFDDDDDDDDDGAAVVGVYVELLAGKGSG